MADEEVIRRRLQIDGDGIGDDRRLNVLLKNIIKWENSVDESPTENQMMYDRILCQLSQCEFAVKRSQLMQRANLKQTKDYNQLQEKLQKDINQVKKLIDSSKHNLTLAKVSKQNRIMYDILAASIEEQPARKKTYKKLVELKSELSERSEENKVLEQKLDNWRKQFKILIDSANVLSAKVEETEAKEVDSSIGMLDDINSPGPELMSE